jgi:hypothetical protein
VKVLLKSLLVWLMLLAVPLQGYASATSFLCAPLGTAPQRPAPQLDHPAMSAAQHADHMHTVAVDTSEHHADTDKASASHHAGGKCSACSACCSGAAMAASQAARMPVQTQQFTVAPFDPGSVPAVDLALPERPPQALLT